MFDGLPFDPFALFDDGIGPAEVGGGGRHVVQALVVTSVVIMLDERFDLSGHPSVRCWCGARWVAVALAGR